MRVLNLLGTRGIPAQHGGFETFAEKFSCFLVKRGWTVTVYCQIKNGGKLDSDNWNGVHRILIPVSQSGALGTMIFDLKSILHARRQRGGILTLGYNTAVFSILFRLRSIPHIINMDGLEWKRDKWRWYEKLWLYLNERFGCMVADHLIADHPEIERHLQTRIQKEKITMIPYGADAVHNADRAVLQRLGLIASEYLIIIARPEPENSILEMVTAFSRVKTAIKLVVLGEFNPKTNPYHARVMDAASSSVLFAGAIYDQRDVQSLRFHALFYMHGHKVGGTNPSLVEALAAGCAVLAHDNPFNRWVAGEAGCYFSGPDDCEAHIVALLKDEASLRKMREAARLQHAQNFTWERILGEYERLLLEKGVLAK